MDKDNGWIKEIIKQLVDLNLKEYQMKMEMKAEFKELWKEHEKWLKQHDVRLGEHWKHIAKTK